MKVYLDVCCLNRLFDDPTQPRVALEAAAIVAVLRLIDSGRLTDYSSEMAQEELGRIRDNERRRGVNSLLPPQKRIIPLTDGLLDAAERIVALGFDLADAVHLAAARQAKVDAFLTVDDKLLRRATKHKRALKIRVTNPAAFLQELGDDIIR